MQTQQIRYFVALCEERNFTRAARRCGVAQPSLTRAIKLLEQDLGGVLFCRGKRKTGLSSLGEAVQPYFYQIDQAMTAAKREVDRAAEIAIAVWPISHKAPGDRVHDADSSFASK